MKYLTRADEILLMAIWRLDDNAYTVTIAEQVKELASKELSFGSLWVSLDLLCKKEYLTKRLSESIPERGGKGKIYYSITQKGIESLLETKKLQDSLWKNFPDSIKKAGI